MADYVLGAQMYTLRNFCKTIEDVRVTLKKVADIGYKAIQISGFGPMDHNEVAAVVKANGLTVAATHMGWPMFQNELAKVIDIHHAWGCKHSAIGGLPGEYFTLDGAKRFADEVKPIAQKLKAAGLTFSYHNHAHELMKLDGRTWLERMYELTAGYVSAEIDVHWITRGGGDPAQWVAKYPQRQPLLHLKDMVFFRDEARKINEPRMAEIGEGNLNWPAILAAAKAAGVEWYLVEQDDCYGRDPFESLAISYRNLRAMGLR
jgi:sugar phosphate isomerase/epimerase